MEMYLKDEVLGQIAETGGNIAQFVSYAPNGIQRFVRVRDVPVGYAFASVKDAVDALRATGAEFVNIRSFLPGKPDGNPFIMGRKAKLVTSEQVAEKALELMSQGYYVILNEEIDIFDGGFSGVLLGNVAEFAPMDVPRCVEKPGCAVLSRLKMLDMARTMYHQRINIPYGREYRVEYSVHPSPVGYYRAHQIVWQVERTTHGKEIPEPKPFWPNRMSEQMGDKPYGLFIAHLYGFLVPKTMVVSRIIPPFEFGVLTGSPETCWRRTAPKVQQPGLFTTKRGQIDPFALMVKEDPDGSRIAALLFQDDVEAVYSGAAITDAARGVIIEGKSGHGDDFMVGSAVPESTLPDHVTDAVLNIWEKACEVFGSVRFEWCYDKTGTLWIVQLHVGQSASIGNVIFPGEPSRFEVFEVSRGLEELRTLADRAQTEGFGVIVKGNVGITSHFGDILRRKSVPSRLERS